jgi:hypothetical protein
MDKAPMSYEAMRIIMIDLYIANAAVEMSPDKNKDSLKRIYHTEICKIHDISSKELKECIGYVNSNLKLNSRLQREIIDSLANNNMLNKKPIWLNQVQK